VNILLRVGPTVRAKLKVIIYYLNSTQFQFFVKRQGSRPSTEETPDTPLSNSTTEISAISGRFLRQLATIHAPIRLPGACPEVYR
jgi:hypothetical protein